MLAAASEVSVLPAVTGLIAQATLVFPRPLGAGHKADRTAAAAAVESAAAAVVQERGKSLPRLAVDVLVLKATKNNV